MLELFWFILTMACVVWYGTITFLVAFKGAGDIKSMLARLGSEEHQAEENLSTDQTD
jgi:hypothetical protein